MFPGRGRFSGGQPRGDRNTARNDSRGGGERRNDRGTERGWERNSQRSADQGYAAEDNATFSRKRAPADREDEGRIAKYPKFDEDSGRDESRIVKLVTNAVNISLNPQKFKKLHVYSVKYTGPRTLQIKDDRLKSLLVTNKAIWHKLPPNRLIDYRCEDGAKMYCIQLADSGVDASDTMKELGAVDVTIKSRTGDEQWSVQFVEEHSSPLKSPRDNPTLFLNWLNLIASQAFVASGYSLLGTGSRIVNMKNERGIKQLKATPGYLVPGFERSLIITQEGIFLTFSPKYSLLTRRTMDDYVLGLGRDEQDIVADEAKASKHFGQKRLIVSSAYCPGNMYRVLSISPEIKPTDEIEVVQPNKNNQLIKKKTTHIAYLRERYGDASREIHDPRLDTALMVGVAMISAGKKSGRVSRKVYIPAPLLQLLQTDMSTLPRNAREEITRISQRKADDCLEEIEGLMRDLKRPEIAGSFEVFGLQNTSHPVEIEGQNNLHATVIVSLSPPVDADPRTARRLRLDDNGGFMREFVNQRHSVPATINHWMIVVKRERGSIPSMVNRMMDDLAASANRFGWQWQYRSYTDGWEISFEDEQDLMDKVPEILKRFKNGIPRPDVIFGLIPEKDTYNYSCVKRFAYRLGAVSQVLTMSMLRRLQNKAFWKVFSGLSGKMAAQKLNDRKVHPQPWRLLKNPLHDRSNTTCIGICTYRQSQVRSSTIGWGICATTDDECVGLMQDFGELPLIDQSGIIPQLDEIMQGIFARLVHDHNRALDNIIIYRRGVSDSLIPRLHSLEIPGILQGVAFVCGQQEWNPDTSTVTLTWPQWLKEKGTYKVELTCDVGGKTEAITKETELVFKRLVSGVKLGFLEVKIPETHSFTSTVPPKIWFPGASSPQTMPRVPRICYIVANRPGAASVLMFKKAQRNERGTGQLTPCGTIIDRYFKSLEARHQEFYIVPGVGPVGFSPPVRYIVIKNDLELPVSEVEDMTLRMSFMFFNQQGSDKTPHVLRIAETAAQQALNVYRGIDELVLEDMKTLYGVVNKSKLNRLKDTAIFL